MKPFPIELPPDVVHHVAFMAADADSAWGEGFDSLADAAQKFYQAAEYMLLQRTRGQLTWRVSFPERTVVLAFLDFLTDRICRVCGCSELDACMTPAGPCAWVSEDLCSGCAPAQVGHAIPAGRSDSGLILLEM